MNKSRVISTAAMVFAGFLLLVFLTSGAFVTIKTGQKGIMFYKFGDGLDTETIYGQGFHVIAPWNTMVIFDVRKQELTEEMDVLANNGLSIHIDLTLRYRPEAKKIGLLYNEIGGESEYRNKIIIPEIRSSTREIIGNYSPEDLYSAKREEVQDKILERTKKVLAENYIDLDVVLIRSVELPEKIVAAIERKLEQEQQSQEYDFRITKEKKEAERKRIEAEGIKQYQNIVSQSLSDRLLRWQGIEATKELANSTNTKVIVVGGGDSGLPLILGGQ
ncbi:MAG: prohibitin family protein [Bacteroidota bacterium]